METVWIDTGVEGWWASMTHTSRNPIRDACHFEWGQRNRNRGYADRKPQAVISLGNNRRYYADVFSWDPDGGPTDYNRTGKFLGTFGTFEAAAAAVKKELSRHRQQTLAGM